MSGAAKSAALSRLDKLVLNLVQDGFPVHPRPYELLAERLGDAAGRKISAGEFLQTVNSLRERGFIRRLGGIFNSAPLGYRSTLCAARVPEEILDGVAALVSARPEVTHNYLRNDPVNLWFTFCHGARDSLEAFLDELRAVPGIGEVFDLPARKVYKIRAVFNLPVDAGHSSPE
ncbi:MAG: Lrp/AsnC family transcriptional regulator [Deltaproteobacteria bacterium]|jgi:DNA-binding Lrp family transcriptional regulator|nr:Lrp/AsnC family transcriptional regulator [Deltaproteobacteria bacterium]MDR1298060.1 Lrp/AsnC family transcriptional regulator [Deltaproteobacteria bacterium]